ncbi:MAG TPA: FAD-dependent oxidoreductase [Candidatus Binatia bacterium]|nr:FAD-dependent oxidoreductase [Candidatus Binatia bacterium]
MKSDSGATRSVWMDVPPLPARPPLTRDLRADVCIVGSGIAGLTTAYLLAREGLRVAVLDDGATAGGETSRTTAHLTNVIDDRYHWIEQVHGPEGARLAAESHTAAIDTIESIAEGERIACDLLRLDAYLFAAPGDPRDELERELEAARRAGVSGVAWADRAPLDAFETGPCLRFPNQAQFHPLRYLQGVADAIERSGGRIHGGTRVTAVHHGPPPRVETADGVTVQADAVVVATNSPVHELIGVHPKQAAYRTYVVAARVPAGSVTRALYYDTEDPYHYVRLQPESQGGPDLLLVGGEDHKTGQADDADERWAALEAWTRERFPQAREFVARWSGQVMETMDGVAFIGPDKSGSRVFIATGDSGMGMTHSTIAGLLLRDLIAGRENAWARLYDPGRVSLRAAGELAKENLNFVSKYADYVTGGDVGSADEIPPGEGAVLRRGLTKVAAYRDPSGTLHEMSAVCTHLGCVVRWNSAEKSWDCPCHGSRFDSRGRVVNGPATRDLAEKDTAQPAAAWERA